MSQGDEAGVEKKEDDANSVRVRSCPTCGRVFLHCSCSSNALEK